MTNWPKMTLKEAGVAVIDCVHATPQSVSNGYPYVTIPELRDGHVDFSAARKISREDFIAWTVKARPQKHDVILSRRTNPGVTAVDRTGREFALGQNLVLLRADGSRIYPPFLRSLVRGKEWWAEVSKYLNVGAVFDSLKCVDIPKFRLTIPPLQVQKRIAGLLDALDDKIQLNRRMNETLEAMAQAIFRDWFVDFGPTRRKLAGITDPVEIMGGLVQDAARAAELAELFPGALGDNGLPERWTEEPLGRLAEQTTETVAPRDHAEEIFAHYSIPAYDGGQIPKLEAGASILSNKTIVPEGAVLLSKLNPEIERVWLVPQGAGHRQICSTEFLVYKASAICNTSYLYCLFKEPSFREMLKGMATGTSKSHQRVSPRSLAQRSVIFAGAELSTAFGSIADHLLNKSLHNREEQQTLAATRDLLLPKLMSGEIRLREAEEIVEAAQ